MGEARGMTNIIPYDPSLVDICGGCASALLFCYFEQLFSGTGENNLEITKTIAEWRNSVGMRDKHFGKAFRQIGIQYKSRREHSLQRIAGRQFWSERAGRYLFYSLEITADQTSATLRRNAFDIDRALGRISDQHAQVAPCGAKLAAKRAALRLLQKIASP
jgi:hypothetical protein